MQKIIDILDLFQRLCKLEYELLKYINKIQGADSRPFNFSEAATVLNVSKQKLFGAHRRLVSCGALIADGENFRINEEIYRK